MGGQGLEQRTGSLIGSPGDAIESGTLLAAIAGLGCAGAKRGCRSAAAGNAAAGRADARRGRARRRAHRVSGQRRSSWRCGLGGDVEKGSRRVAVSGAGPVAAAPTADAALAAGCAAMTRIALTLASGLLLIAA